VQLELAINASLALVYANSCYSNALKITAFVMSYIAAISNSLALINPGAMHCNALHLQRASSA
jgi:hypothetical protein